MKKYLCYLSLIFNFLFVGFFLYNVLKTDNNNYFPPIDSEAQNAVTIDIRHLVKNTPIDSLASKLVVAKYFSSNNFNDFNEIEKDLKIIDSLYPNKTHDIRSLISHVLTDSLELNISKEKKELNLQELSKLQNIQIKYYYYTLAANNTYNKGLYAAINAFWGQFVAGKLSAISKKGLSSKTDFKYRYLEAQSNQYLFFVNTKTFSTEKVVTYFLESNWGHLLHASWDQASVVQKIIFGFILLLTILAYVALIKGIKNYFYKNQIGPS